jgi:hypothetical protein
MSRQRRSSRKGSPRAVRKQAPSGRAGRPVSPELSALIRAMVRASTGKRALTLRKVRDALQHAGVTWSREGELLFPQDRTALVIELDELIDVHGMRARARDVLAGSAK